MVDLNARLDKCFAAVFPDLTFPNFKAATPESVKGWDSIATITLLTVIGEEFNIQIDLADFPEDISYHGIAKHLRTMTGA
jgi:acyl carrier protein